MGSRETSQVSIEDCGLGDEELRLEHGRNVCVVAAEVGEGEIDLDRLERGPEGARSPAPRRSLRVGRRRSVGADRIVRIGTEPVFERFRRARKSAQHFDPYVPEIVEADASSAIDTAAEAVDDVRTLLSGPTLDLYRHR